MADINDLFLWTKKRIFWKVRSKGLWQTGTSVNVLILFNQFSLGDVSIMFSGYVQHINKIVRSPMLYFFGEVAYRIFVDYNSCTVK